MRPFLMILLSCSSSEEGKVSGTLLDADSDTDSDSDSDSDSDADTDADTGDTEPFFLCGDPDLGIQSFISPVSGEEWEAVYHTDLCIDSSGVSGWHSVSYSTLSGDLICHAGWEVLSSTSARSPGGSLSLEAWTLSFSGQTNLVGDCLPVLGYIGVYQDMDVSLSPDISTLWMKPSASYSWSDWGYGSYESTHTLSIVDLGSGLWGVDLDDYSYQGVVP